MHPEPPQEPGNVAKVIDHDILQRVLTTAMRSGGDFAEVYAEDKRSTSASLDDGRVEQVNSGRDRGAGVRVLAGETAGYAYTSDLTEGGLTAAAEAAAAAARNGKGATTVGPPAGRLASGEPRRDRSG